MIFNHTAHKELWGWLEAHPELEKIDWPGWQDNGGKYPYHMNWCFACGATVFNGSHHCGQCPFDLVTNMCLDGFYRQWLVARELRRYSSRACIARRIKEWPVRDDVECI